ncbi:UNVERIFIED_CONTAM: Retrovirus-related Pol polyprotein from transposon TNT 1-94 [Sesamum radiatum]|uniref:Retrovirus-related Pol polyprotein from transposon TNT 1-94 n=1 Tax=Sesamum radiatum TaxID=300843 RepID=A0AAW2SB52_SESRA
MNKHKNKQNGEAMNAEIEALEKNQTWKIVPLPKGKRAIGRGGYTKLKLKADGTIDRYKARLVAKGKLEAMILDVKEYLDSLFTIKDLGIAKYFLGLEIARSLKGIAVTQTTYISDILQDVGLLQAKTVTTPLPPGIKFLVEAGNALPNPAPYRRLIGGPLELRAYCDVDWASC